MHIVLGLPDEKMWHHSCYFPVVYRAETFAYFRLVEDVSIWESERRKVPVN